MQDDYQLTVRVIFDRGRRIFSDSEVVTFDGHGTRRATFAEVGIRADSLAASLMSLGVSPGNAVGTLCWNTQEYLEAYFAIPCMGAVMHELNPRLSLEQLAYVINHARDRVVIVDSSLVSLLATIKERLETVEHYVVIDREGTVPADALS